MTKITESAASTVTAKVQAVDTTANNVNITFQPKGAGIVNVQSGSTFRLQDTQFEIVDDVSSNKRARFEVSNIGTGLRTFALPLVDVGTSTTLVGSDTSQTLTNKTIRVNENNFFITDGTKEVQFGIDWITTTSGSKTYFLPDPGPGVINSNLIDDVTQQTLSSKTLVQPSFAANASTNNKVLFDASNITASRTVTFPDLSVTLVGTDSTQTITSKVYRGAVFADTTDITKKIGFELSNLTTGTLTNFSVPTSAVLNNIGTNILVTEKAQQILSNKSFDKPQFVDIISNNRKIIFDLSNITTTRTIKFPNEDATILSSSNTSTISGIAFSGAISADSFGGRLRLQTHFLAGW
jgi:hypothetical protein